MGVVTDVQAMSLALMAAAPRQNRPGQQARIRARAAFRAAPVRSLLGFALRIQTEDRRWRRVARGERRLARQLRRLPSSWRVLHSISVARDQLPISHLVIGPPGVFALTSKYHPGDTVLFDGESLTVDAQTVRVGPSAREQREQLERIVAQVIGQPVPIFAVLVVRCDELFVSGPAAEIEVLTDDRLRGWLLDQFTRLTPDAIHRVFDLASRIGPSTALTGHPPH